ncbi:MAG: AAA family ATPase [Symploca sp. SIO2E6]|nr:AAA family ATPase [Symploca sp. SIO2E6]
MPWFNTAGPCQADIHYMLSPIARLPQLARLIEQRGYFVIHAPRQTGKTTAMMALAQQLTEGGKYTAVMLSVEVGAAFPHDPDKAQKAILNDWWDLLQWNLPPELQPPKLSEIGERLGSEPQLNNALRAWAQTSPRPLVIFIDEIDALADQTLITVLRQLRAGYPYRPRNFPHSLALVGVRDVRDYKVASGGSQRLHTASPFNIKLRSLTIANFTLQEVATLYGQHTTATGQLFTPEAMDYTYYLTQGQPWLVNALAKVVVEEIAWEPEVPITVEHFATAKEILIQRQETHLDSLVSLLREPRVQAILEPMLSGQELGDLPRDDVEFLLDLGLCRLKNSGGLQVANPIYQEIIPRVLAYTTTASLPSITPQWLTPKGELNPQDLLESFLSFWRQHGEPLLKSAPYHEIAPHIVLMAFLHRVVNGGGTIEREYAIGTNRMDLCLRYGKVTMGMELKVWRAGKPDPLKQGLAQIETYLTGLGLNEGWLVIFDRRPNLPPIAERTTTEEAVTATGKAITVIRA